MYPYLFNGSNVSENLNSNGNFLFTKDLYLNSIDSDVKRLQQYLNTHGFILTTYGLGSPGNETKKFGALTKKALIKFQEAHAKDILTPIGYKKGTGKFGPMTRNFINSILLIK
jgi:peptidoglycan hydrolase-like protein with peptidoglycan-binding domain